MICPAGLANMKYCKVPGFAHAAILMNFTLVLIWLVQYYMYETYAPAGTNPPHAVTAVTAKVSLAPSSGPHWSLHPLPALVNESHY